MKVSFAKMSGAGNDFVVVEDNGRKLDWAGLARRLCPRRSSIGADGLLVLRRTPRAGMRYYNADGSRAFCGNGSRCAALWFHSRGLGKRLVLESDRGELHAEIVAPERVRLRMPPPRGLRTGLRLAAAGRTWTVHALDTGVPHAVVPVPARSLGKFPVFDVGRALRRHPAFRPAGANVNFAVFSKPVALRTYERGVEDETLACGTGATATALIAAALGEARPPVSLKAASGDLLTVHFAPSRAGALPSEVWLEGPAKFTFRGEVDV